MGLLAAKLHLPGTACRQPQRILAVLGGALGKLHGFIHIWGDLLALACWLPGSCSCAYSCACSCACWEGILDSSMQT